MTFQATVAAQALTLSLALGCGESLPVSDSAEPSPGVTASSTNGGSMGEDGAPNPRPEPSQGPNDATGGNAGGSNAAGSVGGSSNAPGGGSPGQ